MQFRKDINGLRAIAVIAVVLFHFNASWMPGGFAGVDVFFVISGFLMTGIIFRGVEQENFSILKFYVARANRIIPALAVLCLVLLVLGWFYLTPLDYRALGKHVGSSMGFLSNIIYWRESGYFDAASHEKWLLHTWSLSAEWQFYIIYPLVLVAMRKFMSLKAMKATVLVGTVLGFIFCVIATYKWPNAAYYLLPTRAWEMMIGGVAYLYPLKLAENRKKIFEWGGLALIILSYIFISKENLWPGYLALIPVFGAFLLIQAQRNDSIVTGNIVFQSLGKWSYSIYLWHWPIIVLNVKYGLNINIVLYLVLVAILGLLSYIFIERKRKHWVLLACLTSVLSIYVYSTNGASFRVDEKFQLNRKDFHAKYYGGSGYSANRFIYINSRSDDYDFIFIGDSYGLQYSKSLEDKDVRVAGLFDHGCLILPNYSRWLNNKEDQTCSEEYGKVKSELKGNNKPLLLAHSWDSYQNKLVKKGSDEKLDIDIDGYYKIISDELKIIFNENGSDRKYFILGVPQRTKVDAFECLARTELLGFRYMNKCEESQIKVDMKINDYLMTFANNYSNVYFINPNDFLCDNEHCLIIKDREPIHSDKSHLSIYGSPIVSDGFISFMNSTLK